MAQLTLLSSTWSTFYAHYLLIATAVVLLYLLLNRYQKGLNKIPGPWLDSVSTIPRMWHVYRGQSQDRDIELHKKYGKIVRIAPNTLSISDPSVINQLYGITTKFKKSDFYSLAEVYDEQNQLIPDPFVLKDKELHSRVKKNAANAYSLANLVQMEPYVDRVTERLLMKLDRGTENKTGVDLGILLKNYAMDAVFSITFGSDFDYIEKGDTLGMYRLIDLFTDYMAIVSSLITQRTSADFG